MENCKISREKMVMAYINSVDVRPVLLSEEHRYVFVGFFFHEFEEIIPKQLYNPVMHQQFRESKIQVVVLPLKGHKANQTKLFQAVMQENVRKWKTPGR